MRLELLEELRRRRDADLAARSALKSAAPDKSRDALAHAQKVDDENAAWLREVIAERLWPGRALVGEEGSHAAWLLAQHADRHRELQRQCLKLLERAVAEGDASSVDLAYLTDRVLLASGHTQIYGTQIGVRDGRLVACRLHDPETVDERRASVGLENLEVYLQHILDLYGPPSPAHIVCPGCSAEIEVWLPELGGRSVFECASCHAAATIRPSVPKTQVPHISRGAIPPIARRR
jgi:hypothetical protein